jgi:hypothetical protein
MYVKICNLKQQVQSLIRCLCLYLYMQFGLITKPFRIRENYISTVPCFICFILSVIADLSYREEIIKHYYNKLHNYNIKLNGNVN